MPSWPGVFQFSTFFNVDLSYFRCMSTSGPFFSSLFSFYLSIRSFYYVLSVTMFYSKIVLFLLHQVIGMYSCILNLLRGRIFLHYFGMFVLVDSIMVSFNFSFFSNNFKFISSSYIVQLVFCFVFIFLSQYILACFSFLSTSTCGCNFFTCSSSLIVHFCLGSFWRYQFYHTLRNTDIYIYIYMITETSLDKCLIPENSLEEWFVCVTTVIFL